MGPGKRKRGERERTFSQDFTHEGFRHSPYRPVNINAGQQNREQEARQRQGSYQGNRRYSRGGRGGSGNRYDDGNLRSSPSIPNPIPAAPRPSISVETPPVQTQPTPVESVRPPPVVRDLGPENIVTAATLAAPEPALYVYEYITDENLASWHAGGRREVVMAGTQARHDEDAIALCTLYQEALHAGLTNRLDATESGALVKDVLGEDSASASREENYDNATIPAFDARLLFLDCLSIVTEDSNIHPSLGTIIKATGIHPALLRRYLEAPLLVSLGLVRTTFTRMSIRKTTNLLYRQSNYNLLREESEGYSKLTTELFTTSNNEPPTGETVKETVERVKALIGAFDLDVGRVLDIVLDIFASVLVKQNRFYVKFLRVSSWWPESKLPGESYHSGALPGWAQPGAVHWQTNDDERSRLSDRKEEDDRDFWVKAREKKLAAFYQLGRHPELRLQEASAVDNERCDGSAEKQLEADWIRVTGTPLPPGNRVAAQLLGFKLRFYASPVRLLNDVLPVNIIYLAALLIKIGFISLVDLYPHVYPPDERMGAVKEAKMKEKLEREKANRPGGGANALMMAGALPDDTAPTHSRLRETEAQRAASKLKAELAREKTPAPAPSDDKSNVPEPADQKVLLLKSLLCIGALPEALFILGRFKWLPDAFPELLPYIHRILHQSLGRICEPLRPLADRASLRRSKTIIEVEPSGSPKAEVRLSEIPPRKILRWALPDKDDAGEGTDFRFYWDDWADNIPLCQSVDDVFTLCQTFGRLSGVRMGTDPALLVKLVRVGKKSLADDSSKLNLKRWVNLSKRLLVPALSLTKSNAGVVNEVWDLVKTFPTSIRYSIYSEWFSGSVSRLPDIKIAFDQARAETKDVMKRISKTNIKPMARALAKITFGSPGVVFAVALGQIEAYDNLVDVVVECARYFTYLGYDVLTWSLLNSLGGRGRSRVQADGMLTSKWLAALALFAGRVYKRYSTLMNPTPILTYVTEQLRKGNNIDLIVLKEMITSMAGIIPDTNFNDSQIVAMGGGDLLRQQTLFLLLDKRHESRSTARRLMRALAEPRLAGQILVGIARARQTCTYPSDEEEFHLKLLGNVFDEIHRVLSQYLDLLRSTVSTTDWKDLIPDVTRLIHKFAVEPNIAFWICRYFMTYEMNEHDRAAAKEVQEEEARAAASEAAEANTQVNKSATNGDAHMEVDGEDVKMKDSPPAVEVGSEGVSTELNGIRQPWHPVLSSYMNSLQPALPVEIRSSLGLPFYLTFWQLSLYDIHVPSKSYEEEVARLNKRWMAVKSDRSDMSVAGSLRKEKEKKQLTEMQDRIRDEMKIHIQAFSKTKQRLVKEKEQWFVDYWSKWDELSNAIIQFCIVPRLVVSPADALYSFKMIKLLHSLGTVNFRTMGLIDHIFREGRLTSLMFAFSAREAENFGRFLNELLKDLSRWHADKTVYEKEAFGGKRDLPGFAKKMASEKVPQVLLDYEDFRRVLYKWHRALNSALRACLTGGEYMHIRNAINILKAVYLQFPVVNWNGRDQVAALTELSKSEKREDIRIAATSLLGNLKRREKHWMLPQAFNLNEASSSPSNGNSSGPARTATPQAKPPTTSTLSPAAPAFQPKPQIQSDRSTPKRDGAEGAIGGGEPEAKRVRRETPVAPSLPHGEATRTTQTQPPVTATHPIPTVTPGFRVEDANSSNHRNIPNAHGTSAETRILHTDQSSHTRPPNHTVAPRPTPSRAASQSAMQTTPNLPKRPDNFPPPLQRNQDWRVPDKALAGDRTHRETRDASAVESGRLERPVEQLRDPPADFRTRIANSGPGDMSRTPDKMMEQRDRRNLSWQDQRDVLNRVRDNPMTPVNGHWGGQSHRDWPTAGATPSYHDTNSAQRTNFGTHYDRAGPPAGELDRQDRMNQARDERRERPSQQPSPRTRDERALHGPTARFDGRRDDHAAMHDRSMSISQDINRGRQDSGHPPTGPRVDRFSRPSAPDSSAPGMDRSRELFVQNMAPPSQAFEFDHGRLSHDQGYPSRQQDMNYGRLSSNPEIPLGPRGSIAGRGGRSVSTPQSTLNGRVSDSEGQIPLPSPSQDRRPPTGPASGRGSLRTGSVQYDRPPSAHGSAPPTPASESVPNDLAGVHPDRLKTLVTATDVQSLGRPTLPQIEAPPPAPAAQFSPQSMVPPSGPRRPQQQPQPQPQQPQPQPPSPINPSPASRNPPTGPSLTADRSRGDKRFAGIQNMLQQVNMPPVPDRSDRGPVVRGRGSRSGVLMSHSPPSAAPAAINGRAEPGWGSAAAVIEQAEHENRNGRAHEDARDGSGPRRSGRYRSSRSRSPHREHIRSDQDRLLRRDEHRDRRNGGRDDRDNRRERDEMRERDRRDNRDSRDGRVDDMSRTWRTVDRPSSERREDRDRDSSRRDARKRARPGDEHFSGADTRAHSEKRPRRHA